MIAIEVIGNLGSDATYKEFNGQKYIAFNVASTERYKDQQGNTRERTTWVSCLKPGESAVINYLKKGTQVFIRGDYSAKAFTSTNGGIQVGTNCKVRELKLVGGTSQQGATQAGAQPSQPTNQPAAPAPTATNVPPFEAEGGNDDLPF